MLVDLLTTHRSGTEWVPILAVPLLLLTAWAPPRIRRPAVAVLLAVAAATGVGLLLTGPRWTTAGALLAAVAAALFVLRPARGLRRTAVASVVLVTVVVAAVTWVLPVPSFPNPTGPHPVGTQTRQFTVDDRAIVVSLWYPGTAAADGEPATYLGRDQAEGTMVAAAIAQYAGVPAVLLDGLAPARPGALRDIPPAPGRFPLVLFSPGLGGVRGTNTGCAICRAC